MGDSFVIVGDGVAGASAAEKVREMDENADIAVLTDESDALYNRIMLKTFMKGSLPLQYCRMHDSGWYSKRDIDLRLNTRVIDIDAEERVLETDSGDELVFDYLLVASGGSPRGLEFDEGFGHVRYMWTLSDAERIK